MTVALYGHLDTCDINGISGWAWSPSEPHSKVRILCRIDGHLVAETGAHRSRTDLLSAGIGDGSYGFNIPVPTAFFDGRTHSLEVIACLDNETIPLIGSPYEFTLNQNDLIIGDVEIGNDGLLQGWVVDKGNPARTVSVEVTAEGVGSILVKAEMLRKDLLELGDGSGRHGFQTVLPENWYSRPELRISVRELSSKKPLGAGPMLFQTELSYFKQIQGDGDRVLSLEELSSTPLISILLPVYNPPPEFLEAAIQSVYAQSYPFWELCIADDASTVPAIKKMLQRHVGQDKRVRVVWRKQNGHISHSSNSALRIARGKFIALLDHDDLLHCEALMEVAHVINRYPDVGIIYSDEDKCDENGMRYGPYRKYGWDPELLLGQNCISHLGVFRTSLVRKVGGFRAGYEGSQDYDLALRVCRRLAHRQVRHIPRVLYHWRAIPGSTALSNNEKSYAVVAMRKALGSHLATICPKAACESAVDGVFCRVRWPMPSPHPSLTVMLPLASIDENARELARELDALKWKGLQLLAANFDPNEDTEFTSLRRLEHLHRMLGVATGDVCIWIEKALPLGDLRAWLFELSVQALRHDVSLVGPKLLTSSMTVYSAGLKFEDPTIADSFVRLHQGIAADDPGHGGAAGLCRTVMTISENVYACRREVLLSLLSGRCVAPGAHAMSELSLRGEQHNLRTIVTPFAMAQITIINSM